MSLILTLCHTICRILELLYTWGRLFKFLLQKQMASSCEHKTRTPKSACHHIHKQHQMSPHTQATDNWKWTGQICLHQSFSPEMDGNFEVVLLLVSICCALACIASNLGVCKVTPLGWKQDCGVDLMPFTASGETRVWISEPDITKHHHSPCTGWGGMRVINDSVWDINQMVMKHLGVTAGLLEPCSV